MTVEERVKAVICEITSVPVAKIDLSSTLGVDLHVDSLKSVELITAFEVEFEIDIDIEAAMKCRTVQDVVDFISQAIQK